MGIGYIPGCCMGIYCIPGCYMDICYIPGYCIGTPGYYIGIFVICISGCIPGCCCIGMGCYCIYTFTMFGSTIPGYCCICTLGSGCCFCCGLSEFAEEDILKTKNK